MDGKQNVSKEGSKQAIKQGRKKVSRVKKEGRERDETRKGGRKYVIEGRKEGERNTFVCTR